MAKVQTRRTISFNRAVYDEIISAAEKAGMTAAHYVESCVRKRIKLPATRHFTPAQRAAWQTNAQKRALLPKRRRGRPPLTLDQRIERLKQSWGIAWLEAENDRVAK